ncbi:MAG: amino acid ABC transporter substrate-binding protein [Chloroflexi bacterium]|jgi:ABC-type branched-subunit amino acid transport system substrate-binding protein|nr:amino acid ABC transporter substrate-binding protein [Chloroflexota bacterium]MBT3670376.1 amino acid ABC transporter substrate-binding protein [Chloroflexota bacterium]MBT4002049.1 amino acid ABC transporter substrate-binding protein [Chloroflexota bacterium]MBT4305563.1 amino acid ABC transporter substrate-binding protein [Chloroflexota bacterium]MBT4533175.1 amino acid ABC transporter substrate-binding protein [Chloroflexota bacterium]
MKKSLSIFIAILLIASLSLVACGSANDNANMAEEVANNMADEAENTVEEVVEDAVEEVMVPDPVTMVIGYTQSITGKYETSSGRQVRGFNLWMDAVNSAGGIELSDGTVVTFDVASYDDESNGDRVQELYTRLAAEDDADLLISPYSSGLTASASVIAEQYGKVMLTTGAASDANYLQGFTQVFQIYTPASRYLTGAVDLLMEVAPDVSKVAFVYENSKFSTDVVTAAQAYAEGLGYEIVLFEGYDPATTDFGPFINKIEESGAEAILGGGHFQDGSTFARQLKEKGTGIGLVTLLVAPPEPDFADLGDAAVGIVGPSQWEPLAAFSPDFGPTGDEFVAAYTGAYDGEEPSYHSAGGYAAGLVLESAIRDADSTDPAAIKAALDAMDLTIFYGDIRFDTSAEAHGLQIGHSMIYIQWQDDGSGLGKQVVWPLNGATAETLYPIP